MVDNIAIKVIDVRKSFKLPHQKNDSVKGIFLNLFRRKKSYEKQEVLRGISFEAKKGEFLGIVGRNGGGKSTILKILAQIYQPDSGTVEIDGNLTPFIELGVGFNPELTGRENVFLNGALLGFTKKRMMKMYDDIVKFAELEQFMDQKLKNYSSGMQVRLAFSVAIQAKTDILLIDEVLAVGDANFQKKCFDVFESFKEEGRTVIFISHSMQQVIRFCDRAILINKGQIVADGDPEVVAIEYDMLNDETQKNNTSRLKPKTTREARIIEDILSEFSEDDKLLEVAAGDGRIVKIVNSLGIKMMGTDSINGKKTSPVRLVAEQNTIEDVTGLIITDNRPSLTDEVLQNLIEDIGNGNFPKLEKIYIHMPFHHYQSFVKNLDPTALPHIGDRRDPLDLLRKLSRYGFEAITVSSYGDLAFQYRTFVLRKFDEDYKEAIWNS